MKYIILINNITFNVCSIIDLPLLLPENLPMNRIFPKYFIT